MLLLEYYLTFWEVHHKGQCHTSSWLYDRLLTIMYRVNNVKGLNVSTVVANIKQTLYFLLFVRGKGQYGGRGHTPIR